MRRRRLVVERGRLEGSESMDGCRSLSVRGRQSIRCKVGAATAAAIATPQASLYYLPLYHQTVGATIETRAHKTNSQPQQHACIFDQTKPTPPTKSRTQANESPQQKTRASNLKLRAWHVHLYYIHVL
jgi:hypothetical protein